MVEALQCMMKVYFTYLSIILKVIGTAALFIYY